MKKSLLIIVILTLSFTSAIAQHKSKGNRMKAYKAAFITERLDLSPEEAEKFWPIYNSYSESIYKIKVLFHRNEQHKIREKGGINALTDKEAKKYLEALIANEKELNNAKLKLFKDLEKILSPKKILLLYQTERDFNRKLLEEYRRRHSGKNRR